MNARPNAVHNGLGQNIYPFVHYIIDLSHSLDVRWCENPVVGEQSILEFFELYSDKSKTTMKVSGLGLYSLHISFINFSDPMQHLMITHGHKLLSFLTLQFLHVHDYMHG